MWSKVLATKYFKPKTDRRMKQVDSAESDVLILCRTKLKSTENENSWKKDPETFPENFQTCQNV